MLFSSRAENNRTADAKVDFTFRDGDIHQSGKTRVDASKAQAE